MKKDLLRNIRKMMKISQYELAILCKISQPSIALYELGLRSPNKRNSEKIVAALKRFGNISVNIEDLRC